ncbi:MAG: replicative DNA helicase [Desulfobacterales bacterium]|nr:replicative DNA helicase [Desulfobacterales bacterium]
MLMDLGSSKPRKRYTANRRPAPSETETAGLTSGKLPPHALEAEESILTSILIDNDTLVDVIEMLTPKDFYKPAHEKIFESMAELFARSEPVDIVTCANRLKEKGQLESIGGSAYLSHLVDRIPISVNAEKHAEIIRSKSSLRRMIETCSRIVNDCMEEQGAVEEIIDTAESSIYEISNSKIKPSFSRINDLIEHNINTLEERQNNNSEFTGTPTGYTQVDKLTSGLQKTDLIILAARPSMGKTAFVLNVARNVAVMEEKLVAIFSLEMGSEQLSMRLLTAEARVNSERLKSGTIGAEDWERVTEAASVISQAPMYIDDTPNVSVMEIRAKCRRLKADRELGLIVVDYLQLMRGSGNTGDRRDLEIAEISRSLKGLAKEMDVPVIALSQLNRMLEQRAEKRPLLSDLRESGSLEQDADIVAFIYRDEVYNKEENNPNKGKAEIIVAKNRNGAVGTAHLTFIGKYTRFENAAIGEYGME